MRTVVVSGGFDPLHPGHLALFRQARVMGDRLVVIVECDEWVTKKHRVQQPQLDRANLIADLRGVDNVLLNDRADGNCAGLVKASAAAVFVVGMDHADISVIPEYAELTAAGIRIQPVPTAFQDYRSSKIVAAGEWVNPIPMVCALITRDDGRRYHPDNPRPLLLAERRDNGKLELPGGFVEVGETFWEAVIREVKEELGTHFRPATHSSCLVGKYRDGRDIIVMSLLGHMEGEFVPSSETARLRWVEVMPGGEWDNEVDRQFVEKWFRRPQ